MDKLIWKPQDRWFKKDPQFIIAHSISEYIVDVRGDVGEKGKVYHFIEFLQIIGLGYHQFVEDEDGSKYNGQDLDRLAWHAGVSEVRGVTSLNFKSLGICFVVKGEYSYGQFLKKIKYPDAYNEGQYLYGANWIAKQCIRLGITEKEIYRHSDVSGKDIRPKDPKYDPGDGFDYYRLKSMVAHNIYQINNGTPPTN
jgi:N-acetyl-anhydromuramyl-L-alanine amidase AmpD